MPLLSLPPPKQGLLVNELTALLEAGAEGRDPRPVEAIAADIIDRVLRKQIAEPPPTIEGSPL